MPLGSFLLQTALGVLTSRAFDAAITHAAKPVASENQTKQGEEDMGRYDLIGLGDDDDDEFGGIGADILFGGDDDDVLDALVSGAGNTEIIGAAKSKKAAILKALAKRNAGAVTQRALDRRRRYPLGFAVTSIAASSTANIAALPQNLFRPERLVIPSDIAFDLGVRDAKVGNSSQFAQNAEVPAALFSEVAIDTGVGFDTAEVGNQISLDIRNKTLVAVEFTAALVGTIAK